MTINVDKRQDFIMADLEIIADDLQIMAKLLRGKVLLITGATGFFGKWELFLLKKINENFDARVTVVAVSRDPFRFLEEYVEFKEMNWLRWIKVSEISEGLNTYLPDYILHLAAENTNKDSGGFDLYLQSLDFNKVIAAYLKQTSKFTRLLLASSGAIYGPSCSESEEQRIYTDPMDLTKSYAEIKRAAEHLFSSLRENPKFEFVSARCFAFGGPFLPLDRQFAIGNFVKNFIGKEKIIIKSDGKSIRSYLYGADLALWLLKILFYGRNGNYYDVGSNEKVSIAELANKIIEIGGGESEVVVLGKPRDNKMIDVYLPNLDRAFELGCTVRFDLKYCIERMIKFNRE